MELLGKKIYLKEEYEYVLKTLQEVHIDDENYEEANNIKIDLEILSKIDKKIFCFIYEDDKINNILNPVTRREMLEFKLRMVNEKAKIRIINFTKSGKWFFSAEYTPKAINKLSPIEKLSIAVQLKAEYLETIYDYVVNNLYDNFKLQDIAHIYVGYTAEYGASIFNFTTFEKMLGELCEPLMAMKLEDIEIEDLKNFQQLCRYFKRLNNSWKPEDITNK